MAEQRRSNTIGGLGWALLAWAVLLLFNAVATPGFFDLAWKDGRLYGTLADILNHGSRVAIVALGMTLVIATRGVDLSVGAIAAMSGATAAVALQNGANVWVAMGAALLVGLASGAWNGTLVAFGKPQPIVATLVLMVAGRGVAQLISSGMIVTFEDPTLARLANGSLLGLPLTAWMLAACGIGLTIMVRRTPAGLFVTAIGANAEASRLAGVPVARVRLLVYITCGVLAAVAGLIECSYIKAADSNNAGNLLELDAIIAVVLGGTSLAGGRFSLIGSVVGAMMMQTLTQTLYMLDVHAEVAPAPKAALVIVVALLQSGKLTRRGGEP